MSKDQSIIIYHMPDDDVRAFECLREAFAKKQSSLKEDRHIASFPQEIQSIINFVERRYDGREARAINAGFICNGSFLCVNTRQLKAFISRCKSSINSSLQQLGYTSLKTKAKAHECLLSAIPCLSNDLETARQWTVRYSISNRGYPFFVKPYYGIFPPMPILQQKAPVPIKREVPVRKPAPLVLPMINLPQKEDRDDSVDISSSSNSEVEEQVTNNFMSCGVHYPIDDEEIIQNKLQEVDWDFSVSSVW